LHKFLAVPAIGRFGEIFGGASIELLGEDCAELRINDGSDELVAAGYNLLDGKFSSIGDDSADSVGLGGRRSTYARVAVGNGFGFDKLLARPKRSFAAEATVQLPPLLVCNMEPPLIRRMLELEVIPGPLINTTEPALPDISDAILSLVLDWGDK
jgi:hypothetical protein